MFDRLKRLSQKIPDWVEAFVVLFIAFGISALGGLSFAFQDLDFSNAAAVSTLVDEVVITGISIVILYLRGWKLWRGFPFDSNFKHIALAIGLAAASYLFFGLLYVCAVMAFGKDALHISKFAVTANVGLILAVSVINPLFEETFVVYYLFERLKNYGPFVFIVVSSLLRVSYHLYQGWFGVISILPLGIVFAIAFWKTKNLMPLYLAHALMDLIGLISQSDQ